MSIVIIKRNEKNKLTNHDGINIAQRQIENIIRKNNKLKTQEHCLNDLFNNLDFFRKLDSNDTIFCNLDPFAYFYYAIREKINGEFRIIRSVQTGPWNGYLFQESLCHPLTREDDVILHISNFTRNAYNDWFINYLEKGQHIVCYPETFEIPKLNNSKPYEDRKYKVSYIGRLSYDKGFDVVVNCFKEIIKSFPNARFAVAGSAHPDDYGNKCINELFMEEGLQENVDYFGILPLNKVFDILLESKWLIFPSTSNVESLGRVVLEAEACGTPVIATKHAATPEMLKPEVLISSNYNYGQKNLTNKHFPLGSPNYIDFAQKILNIEAPILPNILKARRKDENLFLEILSNRNFVARLQNKKFDTYKSRLFNLPTFNGQDAVEISFEIRRFLDDILNNSPKENLNLLMSRSNYKSRTKRFYKDSLSQGINFYDVGGIAMEICHLFNFNPQMMVHN